MTTGASRPSWPARPLRRLGALVVACLCLSGCLAVPRAAPGTLGVVVAFYPLEFLAQRVGGTHLTIIDLVKPGAEPHDLELRPTQVAGVHDAALVVYLRGFQPAVDDAVAQEARGRALDVTSVVALRAAPDGGGEGGLDPHVWLDPMRLATIADAVAARLSAVDPAHADGYAAAAAVLHRDLTALDRQYAVGLAHCARRDLVTSHAAFGYLAARYGLTQIPVTGINPDEEAAPGRLAAVARLAHARGVTTVFFETLVSPKVAEAVATEIGARAEVLDPIENVAPGSGRTYLTVMRDNLATLRTALGCT